MSRRLKMLLTGLYVLAMLGTAGLLIMRGVEDLLLQDGGSVSKVAHLTQGEISIAADDVHSSEVAQKSGAQILARNFFDSSVGPLDGRPPVMKGRGLDSLEGLLRVEACNDESMRVRTSVAYAGNSASSIAVVEVSPDRTLEVVEGDVIEEYSVVGIGWRYVLLSRWEASERGHCYLDLYGQDDVVYLPVDYRLLQDGLDAASNEVEIESTSVSL